MSTRFTPCDFTGDYDAVIALTTRRVKTLGGLCTATEGLDAAGDYWDPRDSAHILDVTPGLRVVFTRDHSTAPAWDWSLQVFAPGDPNSRPSGWQQLPLALSAVGPTSDTLKSNLWSVRQWLLTRPVTPASLLAQHVEYVEEACEEQRLFPSQFAWRGASFVEILAKNARFAAALLGVECPPLPVLDAEAVAIRP